MLSSDGDPFLGVPAEHSSIAEIHRFEMLRPAAEGTWRTSHTHNPNGEFSLVRSSDAVQVSIGDAPSQTVTAHETLEIACNEAQPVRIASDAGKIIYSGKLRCGDAIFVNLGAAQ
ncbi:MAG: hypothetical protein OXF72_04555 [Gammaproteobacteria bacterium]|nr:hypothetical protein [Gammaproteobacteria bacterium]MCY4322087.1 hypothetical protein [Gammaproteobacteria bacterium]